MLPLGPLHNELIAGEGMREKILVNSSLKRDASWMVASQLAAIGMQAGFFLLLMQVLAPREYGVFVGVTALVAIVAQFSTFGQGTILIRRLAEGAEFAPAWGPALRTSLWGCALWGAGALLLGPAILRRPALFAILPAIVLADLVANKLVELASQAFQAAGRFRLASRITLLPNLAKLLAVVCAGLEVLHAKHRITVEVWSRWYLLWSLLACAAALYAVRRKLGPARDGHFASETLGEGLSYSVGGASFFIYNDIDKTFLAADGFVVEAGFYGAAYRLIEVLTAPLRALNTAAMPRFFAAGKQGLTSVRAVMLRVLVPSLFYGLVVGVGVLCLHGRAGWLLGKGYGAAGSVLGYLSLIPAIRCLHYATGNALTALGAQWHRTSIQMGAAAFNVGLNLYLIPRFGWQGAAASSIANESSLAITMTTAFLLVARRPRGRARAERAVGLPEQHSVLLSAGGPHEREA